MELTESRQPGEAWARHRGARAGVFGEAPRGREIVQASIPPTSRPLQPWRRSPGRAAADRFANACGAAFAETAPKGDLRTATQATAAAQSWGQHKPYARGFAEDDQGRGYHASDGRRRNPGAG